MISLIQPLDIMFRVILAITLLFIATRLLTQRSLAKLTYFDCVSASILGTIAGNLAFNTKVHISIFVFSIVFTTIAIILISYAAIKFRPIRQFLGGKPIILIEHGKILEHNMKKMNYSYDYLNQQLRGEKVFNISQVESAILEANGELSVQLKSQNRAVTPEDLNIKIENEGLAKEIIIEGKIIRSNFQESGLTEEWLNNQLSRRGIENIKEVAFAAVSSNGRLYIDLYNDSLDRN
ncbi:DUF421 domain-containing protein [Clostridium bovifaecis]|uniref:DUF421 domain-containing protein n=1 Tax=Clostridium bovifaecis TaxID=2184719 RepID=A0A6I6EUF0_9CLOT|nr:DUF421 domain-containing protein [Clostridium bovifaecis]